MVKAAVIHGYQEFVSSGQESSARTSSIDSWWRVTSMRAAPTETPRNRSVGGFRGFSRISGFSGLSGARSPFARAMLSWIETNKSFNLGPFGARRIVRQEGTRTITCHIHISCLRVYLEGQVDLASRLVAPITHILTPVIPLISTYILSPPDSPISVYHGLLLPQARFPVVGFNQLLMIVVKRES